MPVVEDMDIDLDNHQLTLKKGDDTIVLWQAANIDGRIVKM